MPGLLAAKPDSSESSILHKRGGILNRSKIRFTRISMTMDPQKMQEAKKQLEDERARLLKELAEHSHVTPLEDETGSNVDPEVQADEAEEFVNSLAAGDVIRARINEIDAGLNKINTGIYGMCEKCRKDISADALKASPGRKYCIDCQRSMNAQ